jgi:hypothetical protein
MAVYLLKEVEVGGCADGDAAHTPPAPRFLRRYMAFDCSCEEVLP